MFRNRSIRVDFVKDKTSDETPQQTINIDVEKVTEVIQQNAVFFVMLAGVAYAGKKVIDTTSDVVKIAANAKLYTY